MAQTVKFAFQLDLHCRPAKHLLQSINEARRCKDSRYRRLHPEHVREKQRRKDERRRKAA